MCARNFVPVRSHAKSIHTCSVFASVTKQLQTYTISIFICILLLLFIFTQLVCRLRHLSLDMVCKAAILNKYNGIGWQIYVFWFLIYKFRLLACPLLFCLSVLPDVSLFLPIHLSHISAGAKCCHSHTLNSYGFSPCSIQTSTYKIGIAGPTHKYIKVSRWRCVPYRNMLMLYAYYVYCILSYMKRWIQSRINCRRKRSQFFFCKV